MKFLVKILIIMSIFIGYNLCTYKNYFSEFIYKTMFHIENTKEYVKHIILQKDHINNSSITSNTFDLMNEYFITFFDETSLDDNIKTILKSSNFSILNLKNNELNNSINNIDFLDQKNLLILKNENVENIDTNIQILNENLYKFFKYDNFSIAYLKPTLLTNKDLVQLYKFIDILENSFYIPIIIIDKSNLNESLLNNISHKKCIFIVLDDNFSINLSKHIPILHTGSKENFNFLFQINLFISNSTIEKVRFKIFPINKTIDSENNFQEIFNNFNTNYKFKYDFNEKIDYIYFDYDILKNSY